MKEPRDGAVKTTVKIAKLLLTIYSVWVLKEPFLNAF